MPSVDSVKRVKIGLLNKTKIKLKLILTNDTNIQHGVQPIFLTASLGENFVSCFLDENLHAGKRDQK